MSQGYIRVYDDDEAQYQQAIAAPEIRVNYSSLRAEAELIQSDYERALLYQTMPLSAPSSRPRRIMSRVKENPYASMQWPSVYESAKLYSSRPSRDGADWMQGDVDTMMQAHRQASQPRPKPASAPQHYQPRERSRSRERNEKHKRLSDDGGRQTGVSREEKPKHQQEKYVINKAREVTLNPKLVNSYLSRAINLQELIDETRCEKAQDKL